MHGPIRVIDGCAVLSVPPDLEEAMVESLARETCSSVEALRPRGLVLDFSRLQVADHGIMQALHRLARAVCLLGVPVRAAGMSAGLASALVVTEYDDLGLRACASLDQAVHELVGDGGG